MQQSTMRGCLLALLSISACSALSAGPRWSFKTPKAPSKWSRPGVDDFGERIESLKTGVVAGLAAAVAGTPLGIVVDAGDVAQWEFDTDQLALMGGLFGLVFRYAVRGDENPQLRMGVVGAFALTRALARVRVSDACDAVPLRCGEPLGYLDYDMLVQIAGGVVESGVAFYAASLAVDYGAERGWLQRFPSSS